MRENVWRVRSNLKNTTSTFMVSSFLGLRNNEQMGDSNKLSSRSFNPDRMPLSIVMILVSIDLKVKCTRKMKSVVMDYLRRKREIYITHISNIVANSLTRQTVERGLKVSNMEYVFKRLRSIGEMR